MQTCNQNMKHKTSKHDCEIIGVNVNIINTRIYTIAKK